LTLTPLTLTPLTLTPRALPQLAYLSNSDCGRHDTGWGHPEHVGRLRAIPRALREDAELFHELEHRESRHANPEELALAHDPRYVAMVEELAAAGGARLDADTVVSEGSWAAATAGTGAVLDGLDLASARGHAEASAPFGRRATMRCAIRGWASACSGTSRWARTTRGAGLASSAY